MSAQLISIVGLVAIFGVATLRSVNMGAVAFLATFVLGTFVFGYSADELFAGFPGDLFAVLVGVTLLFAIAQRNGTVDWLVHTAVSAVGGRIALIPWVMFLVSSMLTMVGAVVPGAVAIMAPIGLRFAMAYGINPMLMGLLIINGSSAGGFSPISIFGSITNGVVERSGLPGSPVVLWWGSFGFNLLLSAVVFFLFGGRRLLNRQAESHPVAVAGEMVAANATSGEPPRAGSGDTGKSEDGGSAGPPVVDRLDLGRIATLVGLVVLAVGGLAFGWDIGLLALAVATVLCLLSPRTTTGCVQEVAWPTVLLICGVVTYVSMMEELGTIAFLGDSVAGIGVPLLAAAVICIIGAAVSAFASTTGILGALVPLAVPFLHTGQIGAVGLITALAISSSVVDSSPFSTSGALVVASTPHHQRDEVFRRLMAWGMSMILIAPASSLALFVLPGWS